MQVTLTDKIRLFVTDEEAAILKETCEQFAKACQYVSHYIFENFEGEEIKRKTVHDAVYYDLRSLFHLKSQMACSVYRRVIADYKTFQTKMEKNKSIKWQELTFKHTGYDCVYTRDYSFLQDNTISFNTIDKRVKAPWRHNEAFPYNVTNAQIGTLRVFSRHDKWYAAIPYTVNVEELADNDVCCVVGVDFGINIVATSFDSNGETNFYFENTVKTKREHYKSLRSALQAKGTKSSRRRIKRIEQREKRWMHDINHCVAKALVDSHPSKTLFVIEDLKTMRKALIRSRREQRYTQVSWAYADLRNVLDYKAKLKGDKIFSVNPAYTSQTCPRCGHTEQANRNRKTHTFCCRNCHFKVNDDEVAAINLFRKGIQYLEKVSQGACQPSSDAGDDGLKTIVELQAQGFILG